MDWWVASSFQLRDMHIFVLSSMDEINVVSTRVSHNIPRSRELQRVKINQHFFFMKSENVWKKISTFTQTWTHLGSWVVVSSWDRMAQWFMHGQVWMVGSIITVCKRNYFTRLIPYFTTSKFCNSNTWTTVCSIFCTNVIHSWFRWIKRNLLCWFQDIKIPTSRSVVKYGIGIYKISRKVRNSSLSLHC